MIAKVHKYVADDSIIMLTNMLYWSQGRHLAACVVWRLPLQISSLVLWPILSATLFVIGTCYIDQGVFLLLLFDIVFIFYKTLPVHCIYVFFYVLKELRHLINDIKLDTVLTINKPLTKTSRALARGKVWRFPFCAFCIPLVWMEHK